MDAATPADVDGRSGKNKADENFPVGSRLISRRLRPHVHSYYDFVRAADDVSDSPDLPPDEKISRLDAMERALRGDDTVRSTSAGPLRATLAATGLPAELATDLLIAFRRDAHQLRTADWPALLTYCRYSANPVGRFLLALHGEGPDTDAPSDALCTSLQILNHLQDCADDLRTLDRCYIPDDFLAAESLSPAALLAPATTPALARVFGRVLDGVDALNRQAQLLPPLVRDRRMRAETAIIVELAHRLARRLRREDPLANRVKLHRLDVVVSVLAGLRSLPRPRA